MKQAVHMVKLMKGNRLITKWMLSVATISLHIGKSQVCKISISTTDIYSLTADRTKQIVCSNES